MMFENILGILSGGFANKLKETFTSLNKRKEKDNYDKKVAMEADEAIRELSKKYGLDEGVVRAFFHVETSGVAYCDMMMKVRFEPHVFCGATATGRTIAKRFDYNYKSCPWYSSNHKKAKKLWSKGRKHGSTCATQHREYDNLDEAIGLHKMQAYASTSMGIAQIMGFNYDMLGYKNPEEMFLEFQSSIKAQMIGFFVFVSKQANGKIMKSLKKKDFVTAARYYNGLGKSVLYGTKMKRFYLQWKSENA